MYILSPVRVPQCVPDIVNYTTSSICTYFHLLETPSVLTVRTLDKATLTALRISVFMRDDVNQQMVSTYTYFHPLQTVSVWQITLIITRPRYVRTFTKIFKINYTCIAIVIHTMGSHVCYNCYWSINFFKNIKLYKICSALAGRCEVQFFKLCIGNFKNMKL